jgi:DNA-directed RNA polymerase specialized sigma24 family protein
MDNLPHIPEVFDRSEQTESRLILNKALSKLSSKERAAILLFEIAEFSIEEITSIQKEKSISAVKSRLSRARAKLKKHILKEEEHYSRHGSAGKEKHESSDFTEDLELETIKLIPEIRVER